MQLVVLVDSDKQDIKDMTDSIQNYKYLVVDTKRCNETNEYRYLLNSIRAFSKSKNDILLAEFSGRTSVAKEIGDECSEMVLTLSNKENSRYYTKCPKTTFTELVSIFKGD